MAGKKLPKNIDLTQKMNPADGFFSTPVSVALPEEKETVFVEPTKKANRIENRNENKNLGGRPTKEGLKNEQFTLTMDPELYEKLRVIARAQCRGNFSALIDEAIRVYCKELNINLSDIIVDDEVLEIYRKKQEKKRSKKK